MLLFIIYIYKHIYTYIHTHSGGDQCPCAEWDGWLFNCHFKMYLPLFFHKMWKTNNKRKMPSETKRNFKKSIFTQKLKQFGIIPKMKWQNIVFYYIYTFYLHYFYWKLLKQCVSMSCQYFLYHNINSQSFSLCFF